MAKLSELADQLEERFKDVPKVSRKEIENWVERSMLEHGYVNSDQEVSDEDKLLVILFAEWDGTLQLSLKTAYYFEYKDLDESVDKKTVSEQYRAIASELKARYEKTRVNQKKNGGSGFVIATRPDRK